MSSTNILQRHYPAVDICLRGRKRRQTDTEAETERGKPDSLPNSIPFEEFV